VSRYKVGGEQFASQVNEVYLKLLARSGFVWFHKAVKKAGTVCKNRDKQMTHIVRVSKSVVI